MSVYLKCKANGDKFTFEGKTTADKPYLAMNYTTQTGSESSQTTISKAYFPLTTNTELVDPNKKFAVKAATNSNSTKFYIINNSNTTTTTTELIESKYTGIAYIPVGEPLYVTSSIPFANETRSDCHGTSVNWATTQYIHSAAAGIIYTVTRSIATIITDYYTNNASVTMFKNGSFVTSSGTNYTIPKISSTSSKDFQVTETDVTVITFRGYNGYYRELVNDGKYLGLCSMTRYNTSGSYSGYNNTVSRKFPYKASTSEYLYDYSIYSSYESRSSSDSSSNYSCSEYIEDHITKTITIIKGII